MQLLLDTSTEKQTAPVEPSSGTPLTEWSIQAKAVIALCETEEELYKACKSLTNHKEGQDRKARKSLA